MYENIFSFDVPMYKRIIIQNFIALAKLFEKEPYFLFRQAVFIIKQIFLKVPSVAKLHNQIEILLTGYLYLFIVDQIRMMRQLFQDQQLCFTYRIVLFLTQRDNLACQLFMKILSIVRLDDCGCCPFTSDVLLDGIS